ARERGVVPSGGLIRAARVPRLDARGVAPAERWRAGAPPQRSYWGSLLAGDGHTERIVVAPEAPRCRLAEGRYARQEVFDDVEIATRLGPGPARAKARVA